MTNTDMGGAAGASATRESSGDATPKDMAVAAMQTVKQEAASFADSTKDRALEQVEQKKTVAGETLGDFANAIRKAGEDLAQNDQSMAGKMVKQAADGLEGLSRAVSDKRPEELLEAARDFGRDNPAAFIAGSVLLGFALGRFAKSSERHVDAAAPAGPPGTASRDSGPAAASASDGGQGADGATPQRADLDHIGSGLPDAGG